MIDISCSAEIYTVSQLNREARVLLEKKFSTVWIEGEISNLAVPGSGHWYFSLKDEGAQVRCAMFRRENRTLGWQPVEGAHVLLKARVSLYEGRGDFQLLVEHMEDIGEGRLRKAFEALKNRLAEAGLFDAARKKPLPAYPACIGVITSPTGAAIQDILSVLGRRYPLAPVRVYCAQVQGEGAAATLVAALAAANQEKQCDVLILARGGGSLEDLWPFNEESVALAIAKSRIPVVSGVGHETDVTIADYVADCRAPTPSVAAETVTPDRGEILQQLALKQQSLVRNMQSQLRQAAQQIDWREKQLRQSHPKIRLKEKKQQLALMESSLIRLQKDQLFRYRQQLTASSMRLDALSPLAVLARGFSVTARLPEGRLIKAASEVSPGDRVMVRLQEGRLYCTVEDVFNA